MMPHSPQLQQHWQTVQARLPESFSETPLSEQAQLVLTFSDFVQDSLAAHPDWLAELESAPPQAEVEAVCANSSRIARRRGR